MGQTLQVSNLQETDIKSERNVQGTDITNAKLSYKDKGGWASPLF